MPSMMMRNEDAKVLLPTKGEVNHEEKTGHQDIESKSEKASEKASESEKEKESERVPASRACSEVGLRCERSEGKGLARSRTPMEFPDAIWILSTMNE